MSLHYIIYKQNELSKIINFLDIETTQKSKFRAKNWVEINDQSHGMFSTNSHIKFKTTMLKSPLCDYSDA